MTLGTVLSDSSATTIINEVKEKLPKNKLMRIADGSPATWRRFHEYEQNDYAEDSNDDQKIKSAESWAMRQTFSSPAD